MATKVLDQVLLLVPHIVEMSWAQSRNNGFQKTYVFITLITLNDKSHRGQTHLKMTTRRVILSVQIEHQKDNDDRGIEEFDISDHWQGGVANN